MVNIYVQIDGIKGESTDQDHKDWIEVLSVGQSISQSASPTTGGGGRARSQHEPFTITNQVDLASPKLYEACSSGKHIKNVTIEMMRTSGDKRIKYMVVVLKEVIISHVATSGSGENLTDTVGFNYGTINWTYTQAERADGSQGGNTTGGWDLAGNKAA
jgi:type VI secretion system secreted protein Hcp